MEDQEPVAGSRAFGTLLRRYRLAAGLSQEALAALAQMSTNGIGALERGIRRTPQRTTIAILAEALGLCAEERHLFEEAAHRPKPSRRNRIGGQIPAVVPNASVAQPHSATALSSFVGREVELAEVIGLLHGHQMVTIAGAGGIGKTRVASEAANNFGGANKPTYFVELAALGDESLVASAIALTLGLEARSDDTLIEALCRHFDQREPLLILDNCEHVIAGAAAVAVALLRRCARLHVLATSREPLRIPGEHTYHLPPLAAPPTDAERILTAANAATYGSIALFTERARAVDHRFVLTDENAPIIAEVCRRLDGIPLAIELAAVRVTILPVRILAAKLDRRFEILTSGERTAPARHQTMRALIDWSYDLLSPREQAMFERLSVFAGGATLDAATFVWGDDGESEFDALDVLSSLVDKSLAVADLRGSEPRYRLLESARQYAREKVAARKEYVLVAERHAVACLDLAGELQDAYDAGPDRVWHELARQDLDNWRAALEWTLVGPGNVVLGQRLVGALHLLWSHVVPAEGKRWTLRACELINEHTPLIALAALGHAEAAVAWQTWGNSEQLARAEVALAHHRALGDDIATAWAQADFGLALLVAGRLEEGEALLLTTLEQARTTGNRRLIASILHRLSGARGSAGDSAGSKAYALEALSIYKAMGAEYAVARTVIWDLAEIEFRAGNALLALQLASSMLGDLRAAKHIRVLIDALANIAEYLIALARYDEAESRAREAIALARDEGLFAGSATLALQHLAVSEVLRAASDAPGHAKLLKRAARGLGFAEARLVALDKARSVMEQAEFDAAISTLQCAVDPTTLMDLMSSGASMTLDEAVDEALAT